MVTKYQRTFFCGYFPKLHLWQQISSTDFSIYVNKVGNFFVHTIRYLKQVQSTNTYIEVQYLLPTNIIILFEDYSKQLRIQTYFAIHLHNYLSTYIVHTYLGTILNEQNE